MAKKVAWLEVHYEKDGYIHQDFIRGQQEAKRIAKMNNGQIVNIIYNK